MPRLITVAAAQLGPIARSETRSLVVKRLLALLAEAHGRGADLVVFPELALTTFFPRWWMEDQAEIDAFFEREMPGPETRPLFDEARRLGIGLCLGYAELVADGGGTRRFNTSILVDQAGRLVGKYRKIHLPGHAEHEPWRAFQHLEKRYFDVGDLGWPVWRAFGGLVGMCICNDRRWPETYRVMGLQGVEMILLGYNTPVHNPPAPEHDLLGAFHNHLVDAGGRVPERDVGGGRGQVRARGGMRPARPERHHRALRRDRRHVHDARRRGRDGALRPRRHALLQGHRVQLRQAPPPGALPDDRRPHRGRTAHVAGAGG